MINRFQISDKTSIYLISLITLTHFLFLIYLFSPAISTPDAQGYFSQGKLIATKAQTYLEPENNLQYIGPHWHSSDNEKYFTTFPPGFPLLIAVIYKFFGAKATLWINPVLASFSIIIFFFLSKHWLSNSWALLATFLFSLNPFFNEHALFGDSHISVIFFLLTSFFRQNLLRHK